MLEVLAAVALITALTIDPLAAGGASTDRRRKPVPAAAEDAGADALSSALAPIAASNEEGRAGEARAPSHAVSREHGREPRRLWARGTLCSAKSPGWRAAFAAFSNLRCVFASPVANLTADPDGRPAFFRLNTASLEGCVTAAGSNAELSAHHRSRSDPVPPFRSALSMHRRLPMVQLSRSAVLGLDRRATQGRWLVVGPLSLEAAFGLAVPLIRDDFFFRPQLPVYRVPTVMLVGNVGVGLTFPYERRRRRLVPTVNSGAHDGRGP